MLLNSLISSQYLNIKETPIVSESESAILQKILRFEMATQSELTNGLTLSQQSISRLLNSLQERGLVYKKTTELSGKRGQPSQRFSLNPDFAYSLGISLLADSVSIGLCNFAGHYVGGIKPNISDMSMPQVFKVVTTSIKALLKDNAITEDKLIGAGVSTTGFKIAGTKAQYNPPGPLNDFALVDLDEMFSKELNLPVWSENDGNAATIAENIGGLGKSVNEFAYFYFATGVGGGVVSNGRIFKGVNGNAGEFRAILPLEGFPPPTLESLRETLNNQGASFEDVNEVIKNYDEKLDGVEDWIENILPSLSLMVSATSAVLDTKTIVFGGIIPKALSDRLIEKLEFFDINRRGVKRHTANVISSPLTADPATYGASLLPLIHKFYEA